MTAQTIDIHGNHHLSAGVAGAGQFTHKQNSAPTTTLTAEKIRDAYTTLDKAAARITQSFNIDLTNKDDIVQDSWLHLLERNERHGDIEERIAEKTFLNLTANKYGNDYGNDARFGLRSEDFRARRVYRSRLPELEAELGRKLTKTEREQLAAEIRMSFPPGRRPRPDYMEEITQISLNAPLDDDSGTELGDTIVDNRVDGFIDDEQGRLAAQRLHELSEGHIDKRNLARDVWNILAVREDAPRIVKAGMRQSQLRRARGLVKEAGGARRLAMAWLDGEPWVTPEHEAALFAPFAEAWSEQELTDAAAQEARDAAPFGRKDLPWDDKQRVCSVLGEYVQSDKVWDASLTASAAFPAPQG